MAMATATVAQAVLCCLVLNAYGADAFKSSYESAYGLRDDGNS